MCGCVESVVGVWCVKKMFFSEGIRETSSDLDSSSLRSYFSLFFFFFLPIFSFRWVPII